MGWGRNIGSMTDAYPVVVRYYSVTPTSGLIYLKGERLQDWGWGCNCIPSTPAMWGRNKKALWYYELLQSCPELVVVLLWPLIHALVQNQPMLYHNGCPWTRRKKEEFNIAMSAFDSTEACELVRLLLLWRLRYLFDIKDTGLRDDDVILLCKIRTRKIDWSRTD